MSAKGIDVFSLRYEVVRDYKQFVTPFTSHAEDSRKKVDEIYDEGPYGPEPLVRINTSYERRQGRCRRNPPTRLRLLAGVGVANADTRVKA